MRIIWNVYKNAFVFYGRASRKEYWLFYLYAISLHGGAFVLDILYFDPDFRWLHPPALALTVLVNFLPAFAVTVRRLHDVGLSGWYVLVGLIPVFGGLLLFMILVSGGDEGDNEYGLEPDPRLRS